ncbi:hypothetical protein EDE15_4296 [Edaphobacter aggregans]|uniref:Uncharacterized protein n=1 Tax=Edaphobacter aggregans TaxID=570835 RepID=A0A3R9QDG8_9BACT|nr:hypothetical protein EDE15_4296 [Edaphobacter aggregans]
MALLIQQYKLAQSLVIGKFVAKLPLIPFGGTRSSRIVVGSVVFELPTIRNPRK